VRQSNGKSDGPDHAGLNAWSCIYPPRRFGGETVVADGSPACDERCVMDV
jgi:hypothetical protein